MKVTCPSCSTVLRVKDGRAGGKVKCPKCGNAVMIPTSPRLADHPASAAAAGEPKTIGAFRASPEAVWTAVMDWLKADAFEVCSKDRNRGIVTFRTKASGTLGTIVLAQEGAKTAVSLVFDFSQASPSGFANEFGPNIPILKKLSPEVAVKAGIEAALTANLKVKFPAAGGCLGTLLLAVVSAAGIACAVAAAALFVLADAMPGTR